jgi:hypothetical protein
MGVGRSYTDTWLPISAFLSCSARSCLHIEARPWSQMIDRQQKTKTKMKVFMHQSYGCRSLFYVVEAGLPGGMIGHVNVDMWSFVMQVGPGPPCP